MYINAEYEVILPKREIPWIYDGLEQPTVIKKVYVTPDGYFPRMRDIETLFGEASWKSAQRRIKNPNTKYDKWYAISKPTTDDVYKAIKNVNLWYRWFHILEDNCPFCTALDEALFKEKCWLVTTNHSCGYPHQDLDELEMTYSYNGLDYEVNIHEWIQGDSPHLKQDNS